MDIRPYVEVFSLSADSLVRGEERNLVTHKVVRSSVTFTDNLAFGMLDDESSRTLIIGRHGEEEFDDEDDDVDVDMMLKKQQLPSSSIDDRPTSSPIVVTEQPKKIGMRLGMGRKVSLRQAEMVTGVVENPMVENPMVENQTMPNDKGLTSIGDEYVNSDGSIIPEHADGEDREGKIEDDDEDEDEDEDEDGENDASDSNAQQMLYTFEVTELQKHEPRPIRILRTFAGSKIKRDKPPKNCMCSECEAMRDKGQHHWVHTRDQDSGSRNGEPVQKQERTELAQPITRLLFGVRTKRKMQHWVRALMKHRDAKKKLEEKQCGHTLTAGSSEAEVTWPDAMCGYVSISIAKPTQHPFVACCSSLLLLLCTLTGCVICYGCFLACMQKLWGRAAVASTRKNSRNPPARRQKQPKKSAESFTGVMKIQWLELKDGDLRLYPTKGAADRAEQYARVFLRGVV
jgi:hypothetical protein